MFLKIPLTMFIQLAPYFLLNKQISVPNIKKV